MAPDPSPFAVQESPMKSDGTRWTIVVSVLAVLAAALGAYGVFGGRTEKLARMTAVRCRSWVCRPISRRARRRRSGSPISPCTIRRSDLVARLGGDEFAVIATEAGGRGPMARLARRLTAALSADRKSVV